jgi:hypothetical protein
MYWWNWESANFFNLQRNNYHFLPNRKVYSRVSWFYFTMHWVAGSAKNVFWESGYFIHSSGEGAEPLSGEGTHICIIWGGGWVREGIQERVEGKRGKHMGRIQLHHGSVYTPTGSREEAVSCTMWSTLSSKGGVCVCVSVLCGWPIMLWNFDCTACLNNLVSRQGKQVNYVVLILR